MKIEHWQRVEADFSNYLNEVDPLIVETELLHNKFPTPVLNEIRAFITHISRCTNDDLSDGDIDVELEKASRHMNRIRLDLHKYVIMGLRQKYENDFHDETKKAKLQVINNGSFTNKYSNLLKSANEFSREARLHEARNGADSISHYENALGAWREIEEHIEKNREGITNAKLEHTKDTLKNIGLILLGVIITSLINYFFIS